MGRRLDEGELEFEDDDVIGPKTREVPPEDDADEMAISRVLAEMGAAEETGKVTVHKEDAQKRNQYINTYSVEQFLEDGLDMLRSQFGGGIYKIRVYDSRGKMRTRRVLNMIELKKPSDSAPQNIDLVQALGAMMQNLQQQQQENMRQLVEALRPQPLPPQPSRREMLEEMLFMKQVFSNGENSGSTLDAFLKGVEAMKGLNAPQGEATGADVFLELVKQFAPVLAKNAQPAQMPAPLPQHLGRPGHPMPLVRPIQPGPVPPAAPATPPTVSTNEEEPDMQMMFRAALAQAIRQAKTGGPVEPIGDMILQYADDATLDEFLEDAQVIDKLAAVNAEVNFYRPWFQRLQAYVKSQTDETEAPEDPLTNLPTLESNPDE